MHRPILLIHGYSDEGASFIPWREKLEKELGSDGGIVEIYVSDYETLTNEVTVKDIAEGLNRAIRNEPKLWNKDGSMKEFDAVVHSTGMLVIRSWLTAYKERRQLLKHLIALAPATFGSPLAHKGMSWLGAIFKGNKEAGPDFMEAGKLVLDALELGSAFTWDLAHTDLLNPDEVYYGLHPDTPYVFIFCGDTGYGGLRRFISPDGSDGTVRWAACPLNTRKLCMDLTENPHAGEHQDARVSVTPWSHTDVPLIPIPKLNHGTIISNPKNDLVRLVASALQVSSEEEWRNWYDQNAVRKLIEHREQEMTQWQQFVVRAVDERGDPITDYYIEFFTRKGNGKPKRVDSFDDHIHTYSRDASLRCFYVNLDDLKIEDGEQLWLRIIASTGSRLVGYTGVGDSNLNVQSRVTDNGKWDGAVNLTTMTDPNGEVVTLLYPFTTTLVEISLNREPLPLSGVNLVHKFIS